MQRESGSWGEALFWVAASILAALVIVASKTQLASLERPVRTFFEGLAGQLGLEYGELSLIFVFAYLIGWAGLMAFAATRAESYFWPAAVGLLGFTILAVLANLALGPENSFTWFIKELWWVP